MSESEFDLEFLHRRSLAVIKMNYMISALISWSEYTIWRVKVVNPYFPYSIDGGEKILFSHAVSPMTHFDDKDKLVER